MSYDIRSIKTSQDVQRWQWWIYRMVKSAVVLLSSCRQAMKMEPVHGVMLSSIERCVIDLVHLQNHRPKENCIQTASELFGVSTSVMSTVPAQILFLLKNLTTGLMLCYQRVGCGFSTCRSSERHRRHWGVPLSAAAGQWFRYVLFVMSALHSRCGHYIIFCPVVFLSSFFPRLISVVTEWMSTILLHLVWP